MSEYYKPHRNPNWNYGGSKFRLSRSKIDLFLNCPRCFYIDNKLGVKRPPGFPFALNAAVDHLLKKEFDFHRSEGTTHPLMEEYGINAVPYNHADMDKWRDSLRAGVQTLHEPTGFTVSGGVDDIWVNPDTNELYVVDYKATSKDGEVNLDADWQIGYKRQIEIYQWLLRQNGFKVSNTGYFVYANGIRDAKGFYGKLEFDVKIISYEGNDSWVDDTLVEIKKLLGGNKIPECNPDCDFCTYVLAVNKVVKEYEKKYTESRNIAKSEKKPIKIKENPETLF